LSSEREAEKRRRYCSIASSVVGYSPDLNNMSTEAEKTPLLEAGEDTAGWKRLNGCCGDL
jgi:hypothetical protein